MLNVDERQKVTRYALIARKEEAGATETGIRRRYSLSRLGPSPRSALGEDRHERLERAARRTDRGS